LNPYREIILVSKIGKMIPESRHIVKKFTDAGQKSPTLAAKNAAFPPLKMGEGTSTDFSE
jgi:hypothetical protein